mmetsp:Transcript_60803/g.177693  ORF Transcript_60803/g.177693 Transcript_60803/m.177693 type:complete len:263 (-) Transcript_60803:369-1157(-)
MDLADARRPDGHILEVAEDGLDGLSQGLGHQLPHLGPGAGRHGALEPLELAREGLGEDARGQEGEELAHLHEDAPLVHQELEDAGGVPLVQLGVGAALLLLGDPRMLGPTVGDLVLEDQGDEDHPRAGEPPQPLDAVRPRQPEDRGGRDVAQEGQAHGHVAAHGHREDHGQAGQHGAVEALREAPARGSVPARELQAQPGVRRGGAHGGGSDDCGILRMADGVDWQQGHADNACCMDTQCHFSYPICKAECQYHDEELAPHA